MQVIESGNDFLNFNNSIILLPLSRCEVFPSVALRSDVRSKSCMKYRAIYACVIWCPEFECEYQMFQSASGMPLHVFSWLVPDACLR